MAESPIGNLEETTLIQLFDLFLLEQNGVAKKIKGETLTNFINRNVVSVALVPRESTQDYTASYDQTTGELTLGIPRGLGIASISEPVVDGLNKTYTLTWDKAYDEQTAKTKQITLKDGDYITEIAAVSAPHTPGQMDTYEVRFVNRNPIQIQIYNGNDGQGAPGSADPKMNGTAAPGSAQAYSREDHVHPVDTSRQAVVKKFNNIAVAASAWVSNSTYSSAGFGYRAAVPLTGVTADMFAEVVFAPAQALSGSYCPVCQTYAGGVYIYSSSQAAITLPAILVTP